ncbi:hypothetical protein D3C79_214870 [compost metagenome]
MAPTDSLPNRLVSTAACLLFSTWASVCSTRLIVPSLSLCMPLASSLASRRSALYASFCDLVAAVPAVRVSMKFLMPVAATSWAMPTPARVEPMAASWAALTPATSPSGPMAVRMLEICPVLAAPVLPR